MSMNKVIVFLFLFFLFSCSVFDFQKDVEKKKMSISFGSVYENEKLSLSINDSIYYVDKSINTNSLGTDPRNYIEIEADRIHLEGVFEAVVAPELDPNYIRKLKIDTVLHKRNGRLIIIGANYDKYYVNQQNKKFKVE